MKIPQTKCTLKFYYAVEKYEGCKSVVTFATLKDESGKIWRLPNVSYCNLETTAFVKANSRKEVILKNIITLNKFFIAKNLTNLYEGYLLDYLMELEKKEHKEKTPNVHSNTRTPQMWWYDFSHNKKKRQELNKKQQFYKEFKEMPSLSEITKLNVSLEKPLNIANKSGIETINENPYKEEILFKVFKMEEELKMLKEFIEEKLGE